MQICSLTEHQPFNNKQDLGFSINELPVNFLKIRSYKTTKKSNIIPNLLCRSMRKKREITFDFTNLIGSRSDVPIAKNLMPSEAAEHCNAR